MDFCLGTVQLGMRYGIQDNGRPSLEETEQILSDALSVGIQYFDTAAAYGDAENVLGSFSLRYQKQAKQMRIISKLNPYAFQDVPREKWKDATLENAEESLKRVKKDRFAAYLFHNAAHIFDPDAVEALDSVRKEGLAQLIGVSIYTPQEAMRALEYQQIGAIQIPYNVFDQRLDQCGFFAAARKKKIQIFARSSLLQGLVLMQPYRLPDNMRFAIPYLTKFLSICNDFNFSPLHAAIGYVSAHPDINYVVFGVDNRIQLSEYIAMRSMTIPEKIRAAFVEAFGDVEEKLVNPSLWNL